MRFKCPRLAVLPYYTNVMEEDTRGINKTLIWLVWDTCLVMLVQDIATLQDHPKLTFFAKPD